MGSSTSRLKQVGDARGAEEQRTKLKFNLNGEVVLREWKLSGEVILGVS